MVNVFIKANIIILLMLVSLSCSAEKKVTGSFVDGITLELVTKSFNKGKHKVDFCGKKQHPCFIDGKIFYGGRGKLPSEEVVSLTFKKNNTNVTLDISSIFNPGINSENIQKRFTVQKYLGRNSYRVIGYFGVGKEPYIAHWLIKEHGSVRNHLSDYESLASLLFEVKRDMGIKN